MHRPSKSFMAALPVRLPVVVILIMLVLRVGNPLSSAAQAPPKYELRAAWIATVANIDWPSRKGLSAQEQRREFVALLDMLQAIGMNAVVVQIRPVADALFPSSYEPWSEYLSGTQGEPVKPYYNPLAFMITEARKRGLEFHAWFNPYRASMKEGFEHAADHPINKHPEWFVEYGKKKYYDPGNPEAREFVLNAIMEVVRHYDLDAIHFDDYFYPYRIANEAFPDDSTYFCFAPPFQTKDDWRRSNVDFFVRTLHDRIRAEKPHVKFGISPFGVWRNKGNDPEGSDTQAGQTNYDDLYADVRKWLQEGWIDYVAPQLYWHIGFDKADYRVLVDWWNDQAYGRHVYIGQGIYRLGQKGWEDENEIINQVTLNRAHDAVKGSIYFSTKVFAADKEHVIDKMKTLYATKALVPPMPWLDDQAPKAPPLWQQTAGSQQAGVTLQWRDSVAADTYDYVVYRFNEADTINLGNAASIRAIVAQQPYAVQSWTDTETEKRTVYRYVVTAVDRNHNESAASEVLILKTRGARGVVRRLP